jgi:hypothetical protein
MIIISTRIKLSAGGLIERVVRSVSVEAAADLKRASNLSPTLGARLQSGVR